MVTVLTRQPQGILIFFSSQGCAVSHMQCGWSYWTASLCACGIPNTTHTHTHTRTHTHTQTHTPTHTCTCRGVRLCALVCVSLCAILSRTLSLSLSFSHVCVCI